MPPSLGPSLPHHQVLEEEGRDQKAYVDACFPPDLSALTGRAQDRGRTGGEEGKERGAAGKEGGKGGGKRWG